MQVAIHYNADCSTVIAVVDNKDIIEDIKVASAQKDDSEPNVEIDKAEDVGDSLRYRPLSIQRRYEALTRLFVRGRSTEILKNETTSSF